MRTPTGSGRQPIIDSEAFQLGHLRTLIALSRWPEAKVAARDLAHQHPHTAHYRALLALIRGHEASLAGDHKRAREEWNRALTLEPTLEPAQEALRQAPRPSLLDRLLRRG
ncbi:MAG: hypothetical protein R3B06_30395 [Kofleriaceae bacterium]